MLVPKDSGAYQLHPEGECPFVFLLLKKYVQYFTIPSKPLNLGKFPYFLSYLPLISHLYFFPYKLLMFYRIAISFRYCTI